MVREPGAVTRAVALTVSVALLAVLVLVPIATILVRSFFPDGAFEWLGPLRVATEGSLVEVVGNSLLLGALVVLTATLLAGPLAFLAARTELGRHRWLDIVVLVPFMTPPYIASMGWILFMQPRGLLDQYLPFLGSIRPLFFSPAGIVLIMSLNLYPFLYLILKNAFREIGGSLEDAAAVGGASPLYRFRRITVPLVFSSYSMGALLVFVKTISEFGTPATLGRRVGFYVLTTEIYRFTSNWPIDFESAAALSSILLITSMIVWYLQSMLSERYRYSVVGESEGRARILALGRWKAPAWAFVSLVLVLSIGVPYLSIIGTSLMKVRGYGFAPGNFTLEYFATIFTAGSGANEALLTSLRLATTAAGFTLILGTFFAIVVSRTRGVLSGITDVGSLISNTVPGVVVVVGLIMFWNSRWNPVPVYNTDWILVVTYTVLFLPYTVQYVKSSLSQLGTSVFDAARVSGGSPLYTLRRVLLPLVRSGMVAGATMTFIIGARELVGSLMIRPPGTETSATFIFRQFEQGEAQLGMAMALVTIAVTLAVLFGVRLYDRESAIGEIRGWKRPARSTGTSVKGRHDGNPG
ncbi:MAG: ABC transporter permease [Spirochaetota bacterium]